MNSRQFLECDHVRRVDRDSGHLLIDFRLPLRFHVTRGMTWECILSTLEPMSRKSASDVPES